MTLTGFLTYALALGVAAAVPGPGVVALVARALSSGFGAAMAFSAGLILGDLTYLAAAIFGLSLIAEAFGAVFAVIRYGAALYLAYLAFRLWRAAGTAVRIAGEARDRPLTSFVAGLTITLGNPKTIVFYLAILPTLVDLRRVTAADVVPLILLTAAILLAVMTPYAALAARARETLRRPAIRVRPNRSAAAIMAGAAVWTVLRRA
ncbi:putative membrane protein [Methylobacterium phyllosphaerae]|uniref:Membrane protein n=1 Tax=Methylobacterium phyllosphaerae TaxID=418223 RepID=A0AAE8HQA0_9HYPH|nr:LysE family translocator [Methylobacterium phyllosphaerae]APT31488.1 putative membrane protein [Methylobacterium phyllosphaerae]SFG66790.1 Threonine/homoserine/homoserine lactone efflux protein [Methylobacterium phyllosphaerae]